VYRYIEAEVEEKTFCQLGYGFGYLSLPVLSTS
jgi:hypothetical protein